MSFFSDYLATAKKASAQTGVLVSVILAQWGDETGYGGSVAFVQGHNFAGVTIPGSPMITGVTAYQNNAAGLASYIQTMNLSTYSTVRSARGWNSQCVALGESRWSTAHYDAKDYLAGRPIGSPGIDLITIIETNNLTQYDTGSSGPATTARTPFTGLPMAPGPSATATATPASTATTPATPATTTKTASSFTSTAAKFHAANAEIARPVTGTQSTLTVNEIILNGKTLQLFLGNCAVTVQMDLSISKTSTLTLTIHDPTREVINAPELSQASLIHLRTLTFQLVSVEKSGSVLTCTFESFVVAALSQSTGPFTVAPNTMTRTQFAELLVTQVATAKFDQATPAYLYSLDEGYAHKNKEQLSRGTVDAPLEDSWTCLQRLANENPVGLLRVVRHHLLRALLLARRSEPRSVPTGVRGRGHNDHRHLRHRSTARHNDDFLRRRLVVPDNRPVRRAHEPRPLQHRQPERELRPVDRLGNRT